MGTWIAAPFRTRTVDDDASYCYDDSVFRNHDTRMSLNAVPYWTSLTLHLHLTYYECLPSLCLLHDRQHRLWPRFDCMLHQKRRLFRASGANNHDLCTQNWNRILAICQIAICIKQAHYEQVWWFFRVWFKRTNDI